MFSFNRTNRSRRAAVGLAVAAAAIISPLALAGCSSESPVAPAGATQQQSDASVSISDSWAKATDPDVPLDGAMSGVFGLLENTSSSDLTITGVTSSVADLVELHEVVDGVMRAIEGDVVIPAGGSYALEPGANHIMLMELTSPLSPGDEVPITVSLSDGSTLEFSALVKDTAGANESYDDLDHGDMDHGDTGHGSTDSNESN